MNDNSQLKFQIYYNLDPIIGENVLVKFTERNASHIEAELIEYDYTGIMSYNDATKKKKVYTWNKIIPLNKLMVAKVEDIYENKTAQISVAYNINTTDILKPFNDNKVLYSTINKICYIYKIDFNDFWKNIVHKIDKKRKDEMNNESLLDAFINNINYVTELINEKYENNIDNLPLRNGLSAKNSDSSNLHLSADINIKINELLISKNIMYQTRFGLISNESINKTKQVLKNTIEKYTIIEENNDTLEYEIINKTSEETSSEEIETHTDQKIPIKIKYDSAPYYTLESNNIEEHQKFIINLEKECNENNVFFKLMYCGNITQGK
jgi:hypothetical protein